MKSILFALLLGFQMSTAFAFSDIPGTEPHSYSAQDIENGWYEAVVSYNSPKTYQRSITS